MTRGSVRKHRGARCRSTGLKVVARERLRRLCTGPMDRGVRSARIEAGGSNRGTVPARNERLLAVLSGEGGFCEIE